MEDLIKGLDVLVGRFRRVAAVVRLRPFDASTPEGRSKERYRRIVLTTVSSLTSRAVTAIVGLFTIPLALSYLGKEKYGLWAVITSFVAWTSLFDFGILNSLVNALSEANGKDSPEEAKRYVSTAFFALLAICTLVGVVFALCAGWVPWSRVLAVRIPVPESTVMWTVVAALACVLAGLPLTIVRQIYAGYQKSYIGNLFTAFAALITLLALYLVIWTHGGLPALVFAFAGPGVLISLFNLLYLSRREMPWLTPRWGSVSRQAMRRLLSTSTPLFLFQVGALLVNETQMIVLAHVTSLKLVSEYSIMWRLGITFVGFVGMGTSAFVPAFREAHERGDGDWMRAAFRRMLILRMAIGIGIAGLLVFGGNLALRYWLHRGDFTFPESVWAMQGICLLAGIWGTAFSELLTIMDRIWILVVMVLINGVTTIFLTWILAPRFGLIGAIAAISFIGVLFWSWILPLLAMPVLSGSSPVKSRNVEWTVQPEK
jgi:O-antigen/teichoic acid export membrane protein